MQYFEFNTTTMDPFYSNNLFTVVDPDSLNIKKRKNRQKWDKHQF